MAEFQQKGPEGRNVEGVPEDLAQGVKFFGNRICPFAHRAWWAAVEKEAAIDYIHIDLGPEKPVWYAQVNPFGTVPALYVEGKPVFESLVVAEFLEESHKGQGTALLPDDLFLKATIRVLISKFGDKCVKNHYAFLSQSDQSLWAEAGKTLLDSYASFVGDIETLTGGEANKGPFLAGEFSLLDIAVIPFVDRFNATLKKYRNFDLLGADDARLDRIRAAYNASKERPAFQLTSQEPDFYSWGYRSYAK
eukprot:TRINITY_DN11611_c0_g1_i1.p2 TRINITY_DN11611_c0_g1~~TRINITY_DN11611_c0_g1_i1.p2  ORF type:complete len:249 (-),score=100.61 TRINITY_DN11611_c0_g1_i1:41-787(-)